MIPLITKAQIARYVTLTTNIDDLDINSFINDAQEFDTIAALPQALMNAIALPYSQPIAAWAIATAYTTGQYVYVLAGGTVTTDTYYKALANNTGIAPASDPTKWEVNELMTFYGTYLQPYLAFCFYYRFMAYHGAKITQAGITQTTAPDGNFEHISDARRGAMLGDIRSKKDIWTSRLSKKLNDVDFTFDGVQYTPESGKTTKIKQGVRIYALGGHKRKRGYRSIEDEC
jgi:hypothetical protein